jgi:transposase
MAHRERIKYAAVRLMQADAYSGRTGHYVMVASRAIIEAVCWTHGCRKFFELAELQKAWVALEAVQRTEFA